MATVQAWRTALLIRTPDRLPDLADLLRDQDEPKSLKLQRAGWIDWAIGRGFKVIRHEKPVI